VLTPAHDKSTPDGSRGILGSKDGNAASIYPHSDAHEETAKKKLLPGLSAGTAYHGPKAEVCSNEDGS
jgi:hypothetical protein